MHNPSCPNRFARGGTTAPAGPFPTIKPGTFQNCNRQTGTYKMK